MIILCGVGKSLCIGTVSATLHYEMASAVKILTALKRVASGYAWEHIVEDESQIVISGNINFRDLKGSLPRTFVPRGK